MKAGKELPVINFEQCRHWLSEHIQGSCGVLGKYLGENGESTEKGQVLENRRGEVEWAVLNAKSTKLRP